MTDVDVLVLGRGLGAYAAALAAATADPGASVAVVGGTDPAFDRHPGPIGVLGTRPDERGPVVDPFAAIDALPAGHPYRRLGRDALRDGLELFDEAAGDAYAGSHTDENGLVATLLGHPTPAARYPREVADGLLSVPAATRLVGLREEPDFHAPLAAERLEDAEVPFSVEAATTAAPVTPTDEPPALSIARALDENAPVGARDEPAREALAGTLASLYDGADRVGLPAVLGLAESGAVQTELAVEVGADVFEVPLGPPSVPGRRLGAILRRALADAGVDVHPNCEIAGVETVDGSVETVAFDDGSGAADDETGAPADEDGATGDPGPSVVDPGAVVLATGGPAARGIVADRDGVREPLLDCHVPHPDARSARASADPLGEHALARMGVRVDEAARPLTADGDPEWSNLYAAGAVVGGHDAAAEGSRDGVALASGYVAGTRAAER